MKDQEIPDKSELFKFQNRYCSGQQRSWRDHLNRAPNDVASVLPSITDIISTYQQTPYFRYFESSMASGLLSVGVSFLYQPADNVKTKLQAFPYLKVHQVIENIYSRDGIAGFWTGMQASSFRSLFRESYRVPFKIHTPSLVSDHIFKGQNKNHQLINVVSSFIMAFVDASLTCPFDSLKVKQMTSSSRLSFMAAYSKGGLYNGFNALMLKSFVSTLGFLTIDDLVKQQMKKYYASEKLSNGNILLGALITASMLNVFDTPFDVIKTNLQKDGNMVANGIINTAKHIYNCNGVRGFFKGSCLRLYGGVLSVGVTSLLRELYSSNSQQNGINR